MVNVLIDMINVTRQGAINEITPSIQSALDAFNALTFRRAEAKPGEIGFLAYSTGEWLEISAQIPEGGDEVIQRFLQQGEPEFTEVLPSRERGTLHSPTMWLQILRSCCSNSPNLVTNSFLRFVQCSWSQALTRMSSSA